MDPADIIPALKRLGVPHTEIATALGRERTAGTKLMNGGRRVQAADIAPLQALIAKHEAAAGEMAQRVTSSPLVERFDPGLVRDYVSVEVLPSFAGMGGGGTGEGDEERALLPRYLVEDELRARPEDLLLINVRGNSMVPLFNHGDQLVIDRRDINPVQPGPFALWDGDGYVVKNVERIRATKRYRIFSSNAEYSPDEADPDDIQIMGRPVWFARRL